VIPALGEVVYEYEQDRAIGDDVISDFRMLFIGVAFREAEQAAYDALDARIANEWNALAGAYPELATVPKPADGVRLLAGRGGNGDPRADEWLALAAERRRLIAGSSGREDAIAWLAAAGAFAGRRSIVFHESIAECERITTILNAAGVPAAAHHSGLGGEERGTVLERFRTGALRALVAPRTLDEGIDVPDASFALIAAGTRVRRQTIQRIGRVLRKSNDKDLACVVKLFVEGSADDPRARSVDSFTKALARRAGSRIAHFPADERAIASFVTMTAPLPAS
jgi:superfamily II DNA or RNA helicase